MAAHNCLVSVGIPTRNRSSLLARALESILAQDHARVEAVVSDNASTDDTEAVCRALAGRDSRVRYTRQPQNIGATANFNAVLAAARGDYFMWLSDDDWLDANYLSACLDVLKAGAGTSMVAGVCRLYDEQSTFLRDDPPTDVTQATPAQRVLAYYATVGYNSIFYGLMPTRLARLSPMRNMLANDWVLVATMALQGQVLTTQATRVHRTVGVGASRSVRNVVHALGLPAWQARVPRLTVTWNASRALLHASWPDPTPRATRVRTALLSFLILFVRYSWFRRLFPRPLRAALTRRFAAAQS